MWEAALNEIPIVLCPVVGGGWTPDDARTLLSDLMGQMQSRNPSCMAEVMAHVGRQGVTDVREVEDVLLAHIGHALRTHVGHHLGHARGVAALHLPHEVAQQRKCVVRSPAAAHHREEHDVGITFSAASHISIRHHGRVRTPFVARTTRTSDL